jgi:hypothetical protein
MGNVTFLIGNGFDLKVKLNTRYTDFYKVYTEIKSNDNAVIQRFKKEILQNEAHGWKDWKDFEVGMGRNSEMFTGTTPVEDFIDCFNDFVICFNDYLVAECESIDWDAVDNKMLTQFRSSIRCFYLFLSSVPQEEIRKMITHKQHEILSVSFLQLNYTDIFDILVSKSELGKIITQSNQGQYLLEINRMGHLLHIHGQMAGGYPAIGVDDESQIKNEKIRKDSRIQKIFVKPKFLDALQNRNVNQKIPRVNALNAITSSTVICAFGVSFGDTDAYWWKIIGEWLVKSDKNVIIIYDICGSKDDGISPLAFLNNVTSADDRRSEILTRFVRLAGLKPDWVEGNSSRIIIEFDTEMFNFRLPRITDATATDKITTEESNETV